MFRHVVLLEIYKRKMKSEFIELKTVRNMYVEDIILKTVRNIPDPSVPTIEKDIQEYCEEKVELLIERSAQEMTGHPKQPDQPLIRLRVSHLCSSYANAVFLAIDQGTQHWRIQI